MLQTGLRGYVFNHLKSRSALLVVNTHTQRVYVYVCILGHCEGVINELYVFLVLQDIFPPKWL